MFDTTVRYCSSILAREQGSGHTLDRIPKDRDDVVDMAFLDNQWRRQRKGVAAHAQVKATIEAIDHDVIAARGHAVLARRDLDRAHQADVADVDDVRQAF